jgi:hypothetical protein
MYKLVIGAMFKNEAHALKEWLDHYIYHGVEHFFLINDQSADNFMEILQPYIDKNLITLIHGNWEMVRHRQCVQYTTYILPHIKKTKWLLICDLDEFMWSPKSTNLNDILDLCHDYTQIQVKNTIYGSNGHIEQPSSIVAGFTKRCKDEPTNEPGIIKYFISSRCEWSALGVHHANPVNQDEWIRAVRLGPEWFVLNHYCCQSFNFWKNVKCTRGDSDNCRTRTIEDMKFVDFNDIEDTRLFEQNKSILSININ